VASAERGAPGDKALGRALGDLTLAQRARCWPLADEAKLRAGLRKSHTDFLKSARKRGLVEVMGGRARPRAAYLIVYEPPFFGGPRTPVARIYARPGDAVARRWLLRTIAAHAAWFAEPGFFLGVPGCHRALLPALVRLGLGVETVIPCGDVDRSLARLKRRYGDLAWPEASGIALRPLRTKADIAALVRITRQEFGRNPQYGREMASPRFLAFAEKLWRKAIRANAGTEWVLVRRGKVVGHFGFHHQARGPFGRPFAGVGLTFDRVAQGKGLAKHAYWTMLTRMRELGVEDYQGGTAQGPVLKLARLMGRRPIAYLLRPEPAAFPLSHFDLTSRRGRRRR
jgi:predicted N-acetyltransferase YhbS